MHNLRDLKIWTKAIELATTVYRITSTFPAEERYGLTSQIRRSAVSISSNIAEGAGRNTNGEFCHFLGIANGSAYELLTQLIISQNLGLVTRDHIEGALDELDQLQKMNYSFQNTLQSTKSQI